MMRTTTVFMLAILLFAASASGDLIVTPIIPDLNVIPQGMANCDANADVRINLKPQDNKVLAEVVSSFDISCQKANDYSTFTPWADIGFPISSKPRYDAEVLDFRADVDYRPSVPTEQKSWSRFKRDYYGYTWSIGTMPAAKRRLSIRYSMLITMRSDGTHKPESEKRKYYTFDFLFSGINFSEIIKTGNISIIANEGVIAKIESPLCKKSEISKQNGISWDIGKIGKQGEDDIRLTIEMSDGK